LMAGVWDENWWISHGEYSLTISSSLMPGVQGS
jgi:hypothetical protein